MRDLLVLSAVCALASGCPGDDGDETGSADESSTGTSATETSTDTSTSVTSTSSSTSSSTSATDDSDSGNGSDSGSDSDSGNDSDTDGEADCDAQVTQEACQAETNAETECAWLEVAVYTDDATCTPSPGEGFCMTGLGDFDCSSSGPACGRMEATPYYRDVADGTEVVIAPWWICSDYLPPLDFVVCEQGDPGFAQAACNCACDP